MTLAERELPAQLAAMQSTNPANTKPNTKAFIQIQNYQNTNRQTGTVSLHILLKECFDFYGFRFLMITALKNHCTQQLNIIISRLHCYVSCIGISHRPGRNLSQIRIFWGPQLDWRHLTIIFLSGKVAKVDVDTDLRQHHFKSNYNQELVPPLGQKNDPLGPEYPWGP